MKRKIVLILIFAAVIGLTVFYKTPQNIALADETDSVTEQLEDRVDETVDKLDLSDFQSFLDSLSDRQKELLGTNSVKQLIKNITSGDLSSLDIKSYLAEICSVFFADLKVLLPMLVTILVISVLGSIMKGLNSGFLDKQTSEIIYFVCYAAVVIVLLTSIVPLMQSAKNAVNAVKSFAEIIFPVLLTLIVAMGGGVSAGVFQPAMAIFSTGIVFIISSVVFPFFIAATVFAVVGNLSENVKLSGLTSFFKSSAEWLLGWIFGLFLTFLTIKGITGSAIDNMSVSAAKFALSSYVPVLGGYLSEGFDLVLASCVLIKNAVGVTGVLFLLSVILFPILKICVFVMGLRLTAALSEPMGDSRISALLNSVSKSMTLLISALAGLGFVFFILVMLVIYTGNPGVM